MSKKYKRPHAIARINVVSGVAVSHNSLDFKHCYYSSLRSELVCRGNEYNYFTVLPIPKLAYLIAQTALFSHVIEM